MEEDRISQLPDEILQHILSFFDTYEVVETAILSKRWKDLWRSLFYIRLHLRGGASYHRFVSRFLSHRDATAPLHHFHLSFDTEVRVREDEALVEECVLYAIKHGVQSLRLHAPAHLIRSLPAALFTATTLRELRIRKQPTSNTWTYEPALFSLPNLKTLYLDAPLNFSSDQWMEVFAGLPELEKLSLHVYPIKDLVLKAPKLRFLEIAQYPSIIQEIYAPLLTSFRYVGTIPFECSKMNLPMLEEVYLDIRSRHNEKGLQLQCVRMLQQLGNAITVSLTLDTLEFLDGGPIYQSPPPFPNIKCLKVMKGRHNMYRVRKQVLNYLTVGTLNFESLIVDFPDGAIVDERNSNNEIHYYFLFC